MNRTVQSPLVFIAIAWAICICLLPLQLVHPVSIALLAISIPFIATEIGQFLRQVRAFGPAEVFLRIATALQRPIIYLPGAYPVNVYIASSNQLASILCNRQKYIEALALTRENVHLLKQREKPNSANLGGELVCLAYVLSAMGDGDSAKSAAEEALAVLDQAGHKRMLTSAVNNLGSIYLKLGDSEKAMELFQRSLAMKESLKLPKPRLSAAYNNVGYTYICQNKFKEAEPFLRKALEYSTFADPQLQASARNNLGESLRGQGRLQEAEPLLRQALTMRQRSLPKTHPHLGFSYHNLAKLSVDKEDFAEAEQFFTKAIKLRERFPGVEQRDFKETMREYCSFLKRIGRDTESDAILETHGLVTIEE